MSVNEVKTRKSKKSKKRRSKKNGVQEKKSKVDISKRRGSMPIFGFIQNWFAFSKDYQTQKSKTRDYEEERDDFETTSSAGYSTEDSDWEIQPRDVGAKALFMHDPEFLRLYVKFIGQMCNWTQCYEKLDDKMQTKFKNKNSQTSKGNTLRECINRHLERKIKQTWREIQLDSLDMRKAKRCFDEKIELLKNCDEDNMPSLDEILELVKNELNPEIRRKLMIKKLRNKKKAKYLGTNTREGAPQKRIVLRVKGNQEKNEEATYDSREFCERGSEDGSIKSEDQYRKNFYDSRTEKSSEDF